MIYDKIKIYVTAQIAETLRKDAESFEFFKKDGRTDSSHLSHNVRGLRTVCNKV